MQRSLRRVLAINPDRNAVRMMRACLIPNWPDVEVEQFDPAAKGLPESSFNLGDYDFLLLEYQLGRKNDTGLDWLEALRGRNDCPPAVFVTNEGDESVAVRALKLGAVDYITHERLTPERLAESVNEALSVSSEAKQAGKLQTVIQGSISMAGLYTPVPTLDIPGYEDFEPLGEGGTATVFLARRTRDDRQVVFKVMYVNDATDPHMLRRFMREYKILRDLEHPHVVRIYTRALASEFVCLAMEYCSGGDLSQRIQSGIEPQKSVRYLHDIASGLGAAHALGIIHRDIKPANILFREDGSLAITDFGASVRSGDERLTQQSEVMGTPYYLSPEQLRGEEGDARSDLYALGILFYEILMGKRPFVSKRLSELLDMHLNAPTPDLPSHFGKLNPILKKMTEKDPAKRFSSSEELIAALPRKKS